MEHGIDSHATGEAEEEPHRMIRVAETEVHRRKERTDHSRQKTERKGRRTGSGDEGRTMLLLICKRMYVCVCECVLMWTLALVLVCAMAGVSGADGRCARTQDGLTPAFICCQNGQKECLELLIEHKADLNKARKVLLLFIFFCFVYIMHIHI